MPERTMAIEDLYKLAVVMRPQIAPDGSRVAYVVTTIDEVRHEYRSAIWVAAVEGGEARRLTGGPANAGSPVWSPDGRWLAFVSTRVGESSRLKGEEKRQQGHAKPQIWVMPTDGGEAHQLTFLPHGAGNPVWSPDSRWVAFEAAVGPLEELDDEGKPWPKGRVIDRLWYRLDGVGYIYEHRTHLFLLAREGGEPLQLTDGDWDDNGLAWSLDGTKLAFVSSRGEDRWQTPASDVYTLEIRAGQPGELKCLTDGTLVCFSPSWSPDGSTLAFLGGLKFHAGGHIDVYTIGAQASKAAALCLTGDFIGSFQDWLNSDLGDEHAAPQPVWSNDGATIYALAAYRGATRIFALSALGASGEPVALTPGDRHVREFRADNAVNTLALVMGSGTRPPEIFTLSLKREGELRQLSTCNDEFFAGLNLSELEYMPYTGAEGWQIDGWILKPPNFDPAQKYPLILQIHGGPHTEYGYGFTHEMHCQAASGYVVFYTNPRGSSGYGRTFSLAVRGAWGEVDSADIMAGVDELIGKGYIDETRLGVTGGSYGGFMTNWLISHTDRFKAAVTDRCVTNLVSMFGTSDFGWEFGADEFDTTPWKDVERLRQHSPIIYVENIHTPLLIVHSEQDLRCSIEQAEQLYISLKYLGREVLFVRFEGQSHGLSRGGHPRLRIERLQHGMRWFEKYLR